MRLVNMPFVLGHIVRRYHADKSVFVSGGLNDMIRDMLLVPLEVCFVTKTTWNQGTRTLMLSVEVNICPCMFVCSPSHIATPTFTLALQHLYPVSTIPVWTRSNRLHSSTASRADCTTLLHFHESTHWYMTACSLTHTHKHRSPTPQCLFSAQRGL